MRRDSASPEPLHDVALDGLCNIVNCVRPVCKPEVDHRRGTCACRLASLQKRLEACRSLCVQSGLSARQQAVSTQRGMAPAARAPHRNRAVSPTSRSVHGRAPDTASERLRGFSAAKMREARNQRPRLACRRSITFSGYVQVAPASPRPIARAPTDRNGVHEMRLFVQVDARREFHALRKSTRQCRSAVSPGRRVKYSAAHSTPFARKCAMNRCSSISPSASRTER